MVQSTRLTCPEDFYLDASLEICQRIGRKWMGQWGLSSDHIPVDALGAIEVFASIPTLLIDSIDGEQILSHQPPSFWHDLLNQRLSCPAGTMADAAFAIEFFQKSLIFDPADLQKLSLAFSLENDQPVTESNWQEKIASFTAPFISNLIRQLNIAEHRSNRQFQFLAFAISFFSLPKIAQKLSTSGNSIRLKHFFPQSLLDGFQLDGESEFFEPSEIDEASLGFIRSIIADTIDQLDPSELGQHPNFECDSFINFQQWMDQINDRLHFYHQNPEFYFMDSLNLVEIDSPADL